MCWFTLYPNKTYALDYENGHFEIIHTNLSPNGCPLKLNDGRILILDIDENYIFNPDDNTLKKTVNLPFGFSYIGNSNIFPAVKLFNGEVFIIGKNLDPPSLKFENKWRNEIIKKLMFYEFKKNPSILGYSLSSKINLEDKIYEEKYFQLPGKDKENIYKSMLNSNHELKKEYLQYRISREQSFQALIYNPVTEKLEQIGKPYFIDKYGSHDFITILNPDGNILIFTPEGEVQLYDVASKKFKIIDKTSRFSDIIEIFSIANNKLMLRLSGDQYCFYDMLSNTYSDVTVLPIETSKISNSVKYDNENLLLVGTTENPEIYFYNIQSKKVKIVTKFLIDRQLDFMLRPTILPYKNIIFWGGEKNKYQAGLFNTKYQILDKAEIINLQTGKSTLRKMPYPRTFVRSIILNDGRILLLDGQNIELYVPKGYKKRSKLWSQN